MMAVLFTPFGFISSKSLNYLAFQSFDFECTWWWLFQKRVAHTKFDIYFFSTLENIHNTFIWLWYM
jgi:hypothetical protein